MIREKETKEPNTSCQGCSGNGVKEFAVCKVNPSSLMTVQGVSHVYKQNFSIFSSGASFQMPTLPSSLLLWCR